MYFLLRIREEKGKEVDLKLLGIKKVTSKIRQNWSIGIVGKGDILKEIIGLNIIMINNEKKRKVIVMRLTWLMNILKRI